MSSRKPEQKSQNPDKGSDDYKLVVYRSEDFSEVRSINLSPSSIYVASSMVLLLLCGLIFSLLAFTPLKRLIPGYGKIESNQQFLQLIDGVDELAVKIDAQSTYIGAMRTLLSTGLADSEIGSLPPLSDEAFTMSETVASQANTAKPIDKEDKGVSNISDVDLLKSINDQTVYHPVSGLVSSQFDPTIKHYGVDVLAPAQTPILAMMDGIVFSSGWDLETGYSIGIQHSDNILSFYKHNSLLLKEKGTFVRAGEAVAIIGNTGTLSSGPHLHFELWHNGQPINPQDIINF